MNTHFSQLVLIVGVAVLTWVSNPTASVDQQSQTSESNYRILYRIEIEDGDEAALLQQQLKVKPELVRGRWFYYYGDEALNRRLKGFGYRPSVQDADEVFSRVVRIARKAPEEKLRESGVIILLRERNYWIINGTLKQLRLLARLGYQISELRKMEPRPRQIRIVVDQLSKVSEVVAPRIDVYNVQGTKEGYVVVGGAFDYAIDQLKALGFKVEILPNP